MGGAAGPVEIQARPPDEPSPNATPSPPNEAIETSVGAERRDAGWLTIPNVLSLLRLASVPVFLWLFLTERENAAVILYAVGALTDFFDGVIARRFDQVSELGKLLDPLADRVFIVALAVALVARDVLPLLLAVAIIGRDVLLLSLFPLLERRKVERIAVNFTGKTATASLLVGLTWLAFSQSTFADEVFVEVTGIAFVILGAILYWVAAGMYAREAMRLLKAMAEQT